MRCHTEWLTRGGCLKLTSSYCYVESWHYQMLPAMINKSERQGEDEARLKNQSRNEMDVWGRTMRGLDCTNFSPMVLTPPWPDLVLSRATILRY